MTNKSVGTKLCGLFNLVAGGAGVVGGTLVAALTASFGSGEEAMIFLILATAGALFAVSGVCLLLTSKRVLRATLRLVGLAVLFDLIYVALMVVMVIEQGSRYMPEEEALLLVWLPGLVMVLGFAEWIWLGDRSVKMTIQSVGAKLCGVINIGAGGAGVFGGLLMAAMVGGFGGGFEAVIFLFFAAAGALFVVSGVCLFFSSKRVLRAARGLVGLAVLFDLIFLVPLVLEVGGDVNGDDFLLFVLLPGLMMLLGVAEWLWLRSESEVALRQKQ